MFAWNVPLVYIIFLKRSLVFPILLLSSISLHWSLKKSFYLSLLFFATLHSVQFSSVAQSCPTLCDPMKCSTPGLPVHHQLPEATKPMSIESVMPFNHLILCCPHLLPPSIFPGIRVFSKVSVLHIRWPKYWSFSFSISPSNEYSGLISFRMDWLDLLAVQMTLKSLLQHHSSKHQFFTIQLFL